jgi:methionyl aminopeptidase
VRRCGLVAHFRPISWFTGVVRRSAEEIAKMRKAGRVVAEMHAATRAAARPGVTTAELDRVAREVLERRGARSNFLNYHGFPAVICASPNDMIVHGIPGGYRLEEGDILSIDCGAIVEGYHGDAAFTMGIGAIDPAADKLIKVTEQSLWAGIEQIRSGNRLNDIGLAVQTVAEGAGFSVVREYVGHAIGTAMHEEPQIPNYWPGRPGPILKSGMVLAVEPMVNIGSAATVLLDDGWSVVTADGSLSAHFEHTIAVTDDGPEVLTVLD